MSSPATILHKILQDAVYFDGVSAFKGFIGFLPDEPHAAVCIFDVEPRDDGRIMRGGRRVQHPGVMVQVRGLDYEVAWHKAHDIALFFDRWVRDNVTIGEDETAEVHFVQNISRLGGVNPLGVDGEVHRRHYFSLRAFMTYSSTLPITVDSPISVDDVEVSVDDLTYQVNP